MTPAPRIPDQTTYSGRLAARLRELRAKAGLSQTEFAEKLQSKQTTVSSWEIGASAPPYDLLPDIAKVLKVSVRNLMPKE